uniref:Uncharacterized protein n=1 Tax=Ditylenchus dipsaci TaxID=166011 RepID=A0A915E7G6_9BILA
MRFFVFCVLLLLATATASRWKVVRDVNSQDSDEEATDSANLQTLPPANRARNRQYNAQPSESLKQLIQQGYQDWEAYKGLHGKSFTDENEENERMLAFLAAQQHVRQHNEAYEKGDATFKLDVNNIADLPFSEYQKLNGYRRLYGDVMRRNSSLFLAPHNVNVPESMDWRDHGYVTECYWIIGGQHKRSKGVLVSLSEQNLVDCSAAYGNNGCNGGLMDFAFQYIKENHGVDTEPVSLFIIPNQVTGLQLLLLAYPYKARQKKCHFVRSSVGAEDTEIAVATQGPVSVAIDAGHRSFQLYKTGVYFEKACSIGPGVLVVGYGTDAEDGDYWIVKNSWGATWGEKGYIRMARNKNNHCELLARPAIHWSEQNKFLLYIL